MDYYQEFGGGLGDVFFQIYAEGGYRMLETLAPQDSVRIALISHNPYVGELFLWHPRASQIAVRDFGYWPPEDDAFMRRQHDLPDGRPNYAATSAPVTFYPAPTDITVQNELAGIDYVVFAASAGLPGRNLPIDLIERLAAKVRQHHLLPVFVGRSYHRHGRCEYHPPDGWGIDLIDRLSVPGVACLLEKAAGLICCHSALNMLAWMVRKPQLLLYPDSVHANHIAPRDQWALGVDYKECHHAHFNDPRIDTIADEFLAAVSPAMRGELPCLPRAARRRTTMTPLPDECRLIELDVTIPRLTSVTDVQFLCWLARQTDGNIVEIGCNKGLTTRDLALTNPGKIVYAVDYFAANSMVNDWQRAERPSADDFCVYARDLDNVVVLHAESARLNYDALRNVRMIFIDGDHRFDSVRADTERARAHLERNGGGWLLWHDYYETAPFWVGVKRYVDSLDLTIEHIAETWLAIAKVVPC